jgi:hypothetical protein
MIWPGLCLSVSLSLPFFVSLSPCLPVSLSPCLPVYLSPCLPVSLSLCLLSPCLSVSLSLCLSVSLSPCLLVSLSLCFSVSQIMMVVILLVKNLELRNLKRFEMVPIPKWTCFSAKIYWSNIQVKFWTFPSNIQHVLLTGILPWQIFSGSGNKKAILFYREKSAEIVTNKNKIKDSQRFQMNLYNYLIE